MKHSPPILTSKILNQARLFQGLDKETLDHLLKSAKYRYFDRETEILRQGELAEGIFMILKGRVSVSIIQTNGSQSNLICAGQCDVLGDLECVTARPCLANAVAETGCSLAMWPSSVVAHFLDYPQIARNLIALSYDRMAIVNQVRTLEHKANVDQKIYACLLRMATPDQEIKHSQSYVAEAVGCSRQTVNRVLGKLRDCGIVTLGKSVITIVSLEDLRAQIHDPE